MRLRYDETPDWVADKLHTLYRRQTKLYGSQAPPITLSVDVTGVGRAPFQVLERHRQQLLPPGTKLVAVTITGGAGRIASGMEVKHGKTSLISTLQMLLSTERLKLGGGSAAQTLVDELRSMEVRVDPVGHEHLEGPRGEHDDVVLAVALAVESEAAARRPDPHHVTAALSGMRWWPSG
jgi:hypothetical protein